MATSPQDRAHDKRRVVAIGKMGPLFGGAFTSGSHKHIGDLSYDKEWADKFGEYQSQPDVVDTVLTSDKSNGMNIDMPLTDSEQEDRG